MDQEEEQAILICAPVGGARQPEDQVMGTIISTCGSCNAKIYVAPSGQTLIKDKNARALCIRCARLAVEILKDQTNEKIKFALAPGAAEEVVNALGDLWDKKEKGNGTAKEPTSDQRQIGGRLSRLRDSGLRYARALRNHRDRQ